MDRSLPDDHKHLIAMINAAETALSASDFAKAKEEFYHLLQMPGLPEGGPTAWPHVPTNMSMDMGWMYAPEPHPPTRGDVLLGLGLSALGLGDINAARGYIEKSGFLILRAKFLQELREKREQRRKSESESQPHLTCETPEDIDVDRRMWYERMRSPNGRFQSSGFPREAAKSAIRQSYGWAIRGDWDRVRQLFAFLWKLLGVTYGDDAYGEAARCAVDALGEGRFEIAAFYYIQTVQFEPTYYDNAARQILYCARELIRRGKTGEAKKVLEQTKTIPFTELDEDWGFDISEDVGRVEREVEEVYREIQESTVK